MALLSSEEHIIVRRTTTPKYRVAVGDPYIGAFDFGDQQADASIDQEAAKIEAETDVLSAAAFRRLQADNDVMGFAPSLPVHLIEPFSRGVVPAGESSKTAWGIAAVGADNDHVIDSDIVIAVLDTGIKADHKAFAGINIVQEDFTGEGIGDGNGHGTHCAGTIFGRDFDGYRIGIARGVRKVLIGKVLNKDGGGTTSGIIKGLLWAINNGANVISLSLGISYPDYVEHLVGQGIPRPAATSLGLEAYRANIRLFDTIIQFMHANAKVLGNPSVIIAASGNESNRQRNEPSFAPPPYVLFAAPPSAAIGAISVGAIDKHMKVAYFSNTGPSMVAPGVDILSASVTGPGGVEEMSGTSMATPHVAGVAALWADKVKASGSPLTIETLTAAIINSAESSALQAVPDFEQIDVGSGLPKAPT